MSLAGIPPTAGFLGKYYIFLSLIETGHNVLAVIAVLYVAVAVYYYFRMVRAMFVSEAVDKVPAASSFGLRVALALTGAMTVLIGVYPEPFLTPGPGGALILCKASLQNPLVTTLLLTVVIIGVFPLLAGYIVLAERKLLADFQVRLGPMRVGPHGILQPLADALKLIIKEDVIPAQSDKFIFWMAPCVSTFTALTAFAVLPFTGLVRVADVNVGLLVISAMSAVGVLGIVLGGWSSNSHYALLGALRSGAQLISYEVALAFALLCGVMAAGTLSMEGIVKAQADRDIWFVFDNFGLMVLPFVIYVIAAIAETNRAPFDLPEAESELVAGFLTEFSGFRWALYFLAEYANIFVISSVAVTLFWGGWLRPFPSVAWLDYPLNNVFPFLALAGTGAYCFPLARRLVNRPRAIFLDGHRRVPGPSRGCRSCCRW